MPYKPRRLKLAPVGGRVWGEVSAAQVSARLPSSGCLGRGGEEEKGNIKT